MKKVFTILLAIALCLVLPMSIYADETSDEMIPVCVSIPEDWENPHCWAWADDGTNAFAAWPGEEFETLDDDWYYIYVPSFVQNVIVNANDAGVQTDGIVVEAGKTAWISVGSDGTTSVSYDAQSKTAIPEYVEKFVVHAYVPLSWKTVNCWAWSAPDGTNAFESWPGQTMNEGEDGWFSVKVPTWVNSIIINGNDGSVQTADISIEAQELWITVYEDLTYDISDTDPNKVAENITIHAKAPADWDAPHCWAWSAPDGTNAFSSWPGEALTQDGEWYSIEVPGWVNSVIINANEGSIQTSDLSVEPGKDVWVVVTDAENASVSYEEPATTVDEPVQEVEPVVEPVQEATPQKNNTGLIIGGCAGVAALAAAGVAIAKKRKTK